jgi:16S rRNA G527 N7-methylase RsmG
VVSRAAAPLDSLLESAESLLMEGGKLAAYKGPGEGRDFISGKAGTPAGWHFLGEFHVKVPGRETPRALVIFRKD